MKANNQYQKLKFMEETAGEVSSSDDFNNLIFVSRPINFLNAIELCFTFPERKFIILIFSNTDELESNAIEFLKSEFEKKLPNVKFQEFKTFIPQDFLNLLLFKWYLRLFFYKKEFNLISFSGGVKGRLLFQNIRFQKLIVTDEGTTSLYRFPRMVKKNRLFAKPNGPRYKFMYNLLGIRDIEDNVDYKIFTIYRELAKINKNICIQNFEHLRRYIKEMGEFVLEDKTVIILGSNPHSLGMSENQYQDILSEVYEKYEGYDVFLKTHKTYDKYFGLPVLETDLPIEYYFLKKKKIPGMVMSFGSTANQLLDLLFPEIEIRDLKV